MELGMAGMMPGMMPQQGANEEENNNDNKMENDIKPLGKSMYGAVVLGLFSFVCDIYNFQHLGINKYKFIYLYILVICLLTL